MHFRPLAAAALLTLPLTAVAQTPPPAPADVPLIAPTQATVPQPVPGPADPALRITPAVNAKGGKIHMLPATLETTQWGWFDNAQPPVLTVKPGDSIALETMMHSHNQVVPGTTIEQIKKTRTDYPGRGPHTLTGPIFIDGAEPGDVLKVTLNKIVPRAYATNFNVPGMFGEFPKEFPDGQVKYFYLDLVKMETEFLPGVFVPLKPFPGTLGVARAEAGRYSSVPPGKYAGNLDINEFTEGASIYIPVFVKGGLLWTGDSHAGQGNGEVNLTAMETAFRELNLSVDLIKGQKLEWPRLETKTHWITIGYDKDLNVAYDLLQKETVKFLVETKRAPDEAAATKMMVTNWDCRVSEVVNVVKGTYCMTAKTAGKPSEKLPTAETPKAFVTAASDADLNKAMDTASMAMLNLLVEKKGLSRLDSYGLISVAMDCRVGPPAGAAKTVVCQTPKSLWRGSKTAAR
ncbi:MAG: Acetamidase/Formamidase [Rhodospirillales bacterium]|nr:Acetamidase/Formamidase [Rhodospirillales bacterium]